MASSSITPETIRELRRRLGLSQAAFAVLLNERAPGLATHQPAVARWERGTFRPSGVALHVIRGLMEEVMPPPHPRSA